MIGSMQTAICCMHRMRPLSPSVSPGTLKWLIPHSPTTCVSKPHLLRDSYSWGLWKAKTSLADKGLIVSEKREMQRQLVYDTIKRRPKGTRNTWAGVLPAAQPWPSLSPFWASISGLKLSRVKSLRGIFQTECHMRNHRKITWGYIHDGFRATGQKFRICFYIFK